MLSTTSLFLSLFVERVRDNRQENAEADRAGNKARQRGLFFPFYTTIPQRSRSL